MHSCSQFETSRTSSADKLRMNHPLGFPFIYSFLLKKPFNTQNLFWDVSEEYVGSRLHDTVFTYPISLISYLKFPPFASSWLLSYKNLSSQCPLNPFHATGLFWYPMKTSENLRKPLVLWRFLMFSGVIERDQ